MLRALKRRPYLVAALLTMAALYLISGMWLTRPITRALVGWDAGVIAFLLMSLLFMRDVDLARMKRRACEHDEAGSLILALTILAALASIAALVTELSQAKGLPAAALHIGLAAATVVLSWLFVQIVFALHYAHVYYVAEESGAPRGGLDFGASGEPDYWDFVHFSIVLGATSQTADITFSSRQMRRIGTFHTLVAFAFNTAILATMINLAAALF
ncbi:MAG TPA: DUF1345 domain-containing protein [Rhizomicrobium sp.]|nr:DUF1345 domain-containing protein [Rhizomicrobium sp.]